MGQDGPGTVLLPDTLQFALQTWTSSDVQPLEEYQVEVPISILHMHLDIHMAVFWCCGEHFVAEHRAVELACRAVMGCRGKVVPRQCVHVSHCVAMQVFVLLFGVGEAETEGIYSLRAMSREEGLPQDTIVAFEDLEDAERSASVPFLSMRVVGLLGL